MRHLEDNVELFDDTTSYRVRNTLLMNTGDGKFVDVTDQAGDGLLPVLSSRGAAFDDLDNDGRVDAVIASSQPLRFFHPSTSGPATKRTKSIFASGANCCGPGRT